MESKRCAGCDRPLASDDRDAKVKIVVQTPQRVVSVEESLCAECAEGAEAALLGKPKEALGAVFPMRRGVDA